MASTKIALRKPTALEVKTALQSPVGRLLTQIGFALLLGRLKAIAHPSAKIAARILVALSNIDKVPNVRAWALKELPKLDRELRKLAKTKPEYDYARTVVHKVISFLKTTA